MSYVFSAELTLPETEMDAFLARDVYAGMDAALFAVVAADTAFVAANNGTAFTNATFSVAAETFSPTGAPTMAPTTSSPTNTAFTVLSIDGAIMGSSEVTDDVLATTQAAVEAEFKGMVDTLGISDSKARVMLSKTPFTTRRRLQNTTNDSSVTTTPFKYYVRLEVSLAVNDLQKVLDVTPNGPAMAGLMGSMIPALKALNDGNPFPEGAIVLEDFVYTPTTSVPTVAPATSAPTTAAGSAAPTAAPTMDPGTTAAPTTDTFEFSGASTTAPVLAVIAAALACVM